MKLLYAVLHILLLSPLAIALPKLTPVVGSSYEDSGTLKISTNGSLKQLPPLNVTNLIRYQGILDDWRKRKNRTAYDRCQTMHKRVEWRALTPEQRQAWIDATWCLTARPSQLAGTETNLDGRRTTLYDDWALLHSRLFERIHYVAGFLPWHRLFTHAHAIALRECGYTGPTPYWDWTRDADTGNVLASAVLSNDQGLGGNGSYPDGTVTSGPFAYLPIAYRTPATGNQTRVRDQPHYLQRSFGVNNAHNQSHPFAQDAYNSTAVRRVLSARNYTTFSRLLEGLPQRKDVVGAGPHSAIHEFVGGDLILPTSPAEPLFWLHHAAVDRLWWSWQVGDLTGKAVKDPRIDPAANLSSPFWAYSGNTIEFAIDTSGGPPASLFDFQTLQGLYLPNTPTYKLMDIERPPLCYTYI